MNYRSIISHCLVASAIAFNLLVVLFLVSSFSASDYSISPPNVPDSTYLSPNDISDWFNSDALTQYHFFIGMEKGDSLSDWKISTVSHYFPTIPLFGIGYFVFKNPGISMLFYVSVQLLIVLVLMSWLVKQLIPAFVTEARVIGLLFVSLFSLYALYVPDMYMSNNLLMPYHTGMFVNTLLSLVFLMKYLKEQNKVYLVYMSIAIMLATLSNSLFHVYFSAPILFVVGILSIRDSKRLLPVVYSLIISVLLGLLLMKLLPNLAIQLSTTSSHIESFRYLFGSIMFDFNSSTFVAIIFSLCLLSCMYSVIRSIVAIRKFILSKELSNYDIYHIIYTFIVLSSFAGSVVAGNYVGIWCIRYLIYSFILGLFNIGIVLAYHTTVKSARYLRILSYSLLLVSAIFVAMRSMNQNPLGAIGRLRDYKSSAAQAVDSLSMRYPLKNGVADYWYAKNISVFSKRKVKVVFTFNDLNIWRHSCHFPDYKLDADGTQAYYNFIVIRGWSDTANVCKIFGDSIVRVNQSGHLFYLVPEFTYNDHYELQFTGKFDFFEELRKQKQQDSVIQTKLKM